MRNFRIATLLWTALLIMAGVVSADQQNKKTIFTFKDSVQVPGQVLPAGTYVFKLANSDSNRHIVQIYNQDETKLITTILAIPNYQLTPSGETIVTYAKSPSNQPVAIEAWFYPGDNFGQQFAYPEKMAGELSTLNTIKVPSTGSEQAYPSSTSDTTSSTTSTTTPATSTTDQSMTSSSTTATSTTAPSSTTTQATTTPATSESMTSSTTTTTPATSSETMTKRTDDTPPNRMSNSASTTPDTTASAQNNSQTAGMNSQYDNTQSSARSQNLPQTASNLPLAGLIGFLAISAAAVLRKMSL